MLAARRSSVRLGGPIEGLGFAIWSGLLVPAVLSVVAARAGGLRQRRYDHEHDTQALRLRYESGAAVSDEHRRGAPEAQLSGTWSGHTAAPTRAHSGAHRQQRGKPERNIELSAPA